jgi:hypothetical protein
MQYLADDTRITPPIADILAELELHLQCRLGGRVRDFRIASVRGGLALQGRAATYYAKQLAQHFVLQATTLPIVANDIEVA